MTTKRATETQCCGWHKAGGDISMSCRTLANGRHLLGKGYRVVPEPRIVAECWTCKDCHCVGAPFAPDTHHACPNWRAPYAISNMARESHVRLFHDVREVAETERGKP